MVIIIITRFTIMPCYSIYLKKTSPDLLQYISCKYCKYLGSCTLDTMNTHISID